MRISVRSTIPQPKLIAAPVPSPPRYDGLPQYCTDFVVRADRPFLHLRDTFGGRIGWTVEHSQSGYNAVRHHLLRHVQESKASLFAEWVGPLLTPRRVIDAILDGTIDVGPLDSYVHDLLKNNEPDTTKRLRIVESSAMTPIPPLVAAHSVMDDIVERLRQAFVLSATAEELSATFNTLMISGFASADPADYIDLLSQAQKADRAGMIIPDMS